MMARSYQLHPRVTPPVPIRSRYVVCKPESTGVSLMYCTAWYMCMVPVPRVASRMGRAAPNQKRVRYLALVLLQVEVGWGWLYPPTYSVQYSTVQYSILCAICWMQFTV